MTSLAHDLFGPLGRNYCVYFYYLTVVAFIFFLVAAVHTVGAMMTSKADWWSLLMGLVGPFLLYFNNRLLYGMCVQ
tara:strand:- start:569 stop:796 length:228 start_codon:yes stop_codon:yes gene_type:complete